MRAIQPPARSGARTAFLAAFATVAVLSAQHAQAGPVYNWVTSSLSPTIWAAEGRIALSESLWPGGTLEIPGRAASEQGYTAGCHGNFYTQPGGGYYPGCTALVGIEDIYFNVNNRPASDGVFYASLYMQGMLTVDAANQLTGRFYALSADATNVLMRSAPGSAEWTVEMFSSDIASGGGNGCYNVPHCSGATGRWVLDPTSMLVPEPGGLALVGAALVAAAVARRASARPQGA